jgi:hypothetical protein
MGTKVEINDTLRISKEQGFPVELQIEDYLINSDIYINKIKDKIFTFSRKPMIRVFQAPPVRTFLVEDYNGKWIYWGLCYILSLHLNYETQETSGTYKIIRLNSPEEMKQMFTITHFNHPEENYFT